MNNYKVQISITSLSECTDRGPRAHLGRGLNLQVGPNLSIAPGGQVASPRKGHTCLFARSGFPEGPVPRPRRARQAVQESCLIRARSAARAVRIPPFSLSSSGHAFDWRARAHQSLGVRGEGLVQATVRLLLGRGEIGAYYFQLRHGMAGSYIAAFSSSKWEDWREGWVIAVADPHDRLELPTEAPESDRSTWKARPAIPAELDPVLDRIKKLARSGLTSMMVLGDFLKRRIAPLQQRSRMAYVYTGLNDCCRITCGPGGDFTRAELEAAIRAMTGEAFIPESLVLPERYLGP
jgi:hypothetical protein